MENPVILIVDDHVALRAALRELLSVSFPASRILEAETGEDSIALALAEQPDIVLMDIRLPGLNGIEATRRIKRAHPQIQVVIVSILDSAEYRRDAEAAGAAAYVFKNRIHTDLVPTLKALWAK